jgi:hypothetical protein
MATMELWQRLMHYHNEDAKGIRAMTPGLLTKARTVCVLLSIFQTAPCLSVPISGGIPPSSG